MGFIIGTQVVSDRSADVCRLVILNPWGTQYAAWAKYMLPSLSDSKADKAAQMFAVAFVENLPASKARYEGWGWVGVY